MAWFEDHFLKLVQVTEESGKAAFALKGRGDPVRADQAAVSIMRESFNRLPLSIRIVIGEGERDQAPRLYMGEALGRGGFAADAAVDPLEGTSLTAHGLPGAWSVMALAEKGGIFQAPDIYMKKIACGPQGKGAVRLSLKVEENLNNLSKALRKPVQELTVGILRRTRHQKLIEAVLSAGARIQLAEDGDLAMALNTALPDSPLDLLMGVGGAPEGVLAAAGLSCLKGDFQGRLIYKDKSEEERARKAGISDLEKTLYLDDLAKGEIFFCGTGVTSSDLLQGIEREGAGYSAHSLILTPKARFYLKRSVSR